MTDLKSVNRLRGLGYDWVEVYHRFPTSGGDYYDIPQSMVDYYLANSTIITIDGYSGCGKSTIAEQLAKELGYKYLSTGNMYRLVALNAIEKSLEGKEDIIKSLGEINIVPNQEDKEELEKISTLEVGNKASIISAIPEVRRILIEKQKELGKLGKIVVEGRNIGKEVFPYARFKFFLTADVNKRAEWRKNDMPNSSFEDILKNLKERDLRDTTRLVSPLKPTKDSIIIDCGAFDSIGAIVNHILCLTYGEV